jgi:hypothetical protein
VAIVTPATGLGGLSEIIAKVAVADIDVMNTYHEIVLCAPPIVVGRGLGL